MSLDDLDLPVMPGGSRPCNECQLPAVAGMGCDVCRRMYYGCEDHFLLKWAQVKAAGVHGDLVCRERPVSFKVAPA